MHDVLIVGGGAAAMSAAIYTARKKLSTLIVTNEIGGQTSLQPEICNYPGFLEKDGYVLMKNMRKQTDDLGVEIKETADGIQEVSFRDDHGKEIFTLKDKNGNIYEGRSVIIASGKKPRKLGVPGEDEFYNKGLDSALLLSKYADKVYVLENSDKMKGDQVTQDKLKESGLTELLTNAEMKEIKGKKFVNAIIYKDKTSGEERELAVEGVFVAIGMIPNSNFLKGVCDLNQWGEVVINPRTNATSHVGVFAAGDVTDVPEKQTIIAAGDGAKAALQCYKWLQSQ